MGLQKNYFELLKVLEVYNQKLTTYSEEKFLLKPDEDTWSYAQVYAHILMANKLSLKGMMRSAQNNGTQYSQMLPFKTWVILFFGKFPKGRKVPKSVEERTPKLESIAQALVLLKSIEQDLKELYSTRELWRSDMKLKHPVLGLMNNFQWMRFVLIHSTHHLSQLDKIDHLLNS